MDRDEGNIYQKSGGFGSTNFNMEVILNLNKKCVQTLVLCYMYLSEHSFSTVANIINECVQLKYLDFHFIQVNQSIYLVETYHTSMG